MLAQTYISLISYFPKNFSRGGSLPVHYLWKIAVITAINYEKFGRNIENKFVGEQQELTLGRSLCRLTVG